MSTINPDELLSFIDAYEGPEDVPLSKPPKYSDNYFDALLSDETGGVRKPGRGPGQEQVESNTEQISRVYDQMMTGAEMVGKGLVSGVGDILPANILRLWRGGEVPLRDDWQPYIDKQEKEAASWAPSKQVGEKSVFGIKARDWYSGAQSLGGFSAPAMGAGLAGGTIVGGLLGGPPGAGAGAKAALGYMALQGAGAGAASGTAAYRIVKDQFVDDIRKKFLKENPTATEQEWKKKRAVIEDDAQMMALWEALPEATSNALMGVLAITKVGELARTLPFIKKELVKKGVAAGIKFGGGPLTELATEAMTEYGQAPLQYQHGLSAEKPKEGVAGLVEAGQKVFGPTMAQSILTLGGGGLGRQAYDTARTQYEAAKEIKPPERFTPEEESMITGEPIPEQREPIELKLLPPEDILLRAEEMEKTGQELPDVEPIVVQPEPVQQPVEAMPQEEVVEPVEETQITEQEMAPEPTELQETPEDIQEFLDSVRQTKPVETQEEAVVVPEELKPVEEPQEIKEVDTELLEPEEIPDVSLDESERITAMNAAGVQEKMNKNPLPLPAAIPTKKGVDLKDLIIPIRDASGAFIKWMKTPTKGRRKAGASYMPGSALIVSSKPGSVPYQIHEVGHYIDDKYRLVPTGTNKYDTELSYFWDMDGASTPPSKLNKKASQQYRRGEGVAQWFYSYMVNPEFAKQKAPKFTKYFEKIIRKQEPKLIDAINKTSNRIRRWYGMSAREQIVSQRASLDPETFTSKVKKVLNTGVPEGWFTATTMDKFLTAMENSMRMLEKGKVYAMAQLGKTELEAEKDPVLLARNFKGVNDKIVSFYEDGVKRDDGTRMSKGGIEYIMEPFKKAAKSWGDSIDEYYKDLFNYMVSFRTLELGARGMHNATGIGQGIESDTQKAKEYLTDIMKSPEKVAVLEESADRYREYADALLRYMVEKGRLAKDVYKKIKEKNLFYVALHRVMETAPGTEMELFERSTSGELGNKITPVKAIKGSTRMIDDIMVNLMNATMNAVKEADRNNAVLQLTNLIQPVRGMHEGDIQMLSQIGNRVETQKVPVTENGRTYMKEIPPKGDRFIEVFRDGKSEYWEFQEDIMRALKNMDRIEPLHWTVTALAKMLRTSVIYSPPFIIRNVMRDMQNRWIVSETAGQETAERHKGATYEEIEREMREQGASFAGYYRSKEDYRASMRAILKKLGKKDDSVILQTSKDILGFIQNLSEKSEKITRQAEYKSAYADISKKHPEWSEASKRQYAAFKSRDLMDFARAGYIMKWINQVVPFSNAAVQGLSKTIRNATRSKEDAGKMIAKWAAIIMLPRMIVRALNYSLWGEEGEEEYDQMPAYLRDMFLNIKIAPNFWIRLPQPYEFAVLGGAVERMFNFIITGDEKEFEGLGGSLARTLLPLDEEVLLGPYRGVVQAIFNKDLFKNREIVPFYEKDLALDHPKRRTERASRLAQLLQPMTQIDARKIDFLMRAHAGFYGDLAGKISDLGRTDKRGLRWADLGFSFGSPAAFSRDVKWVQDHAKLKGEANKPYMTTLKKLISGYYKAPASEKPKRASDLRKYAIALRKRKEK